MTFQELILALERFWAERGCLIVQPYNSEVGAGTFNPHTFLRAIGPEPWNVAYVEPSRRPTDGRYGENPNRLQQFHQYQVILKPSPLDIQDLYLESLRALGTDPSRHDIRFIEDDWESPTLGAWGLGWQVWLDGLEISQFTYFQQCGGIDCKPISGELTYGLERIAMYLQDVDDVYELQWAPGIRYGDIYKRAEWEWSTYNFEQADVDLQKSLFEEYEKQVAALLGLSDKKGKGGALQFDREPLERLALPAYDAVIKCSHYFNVLDARGAISVTETAALHRPGEDHRAGRRRVVVRPARGARLPAPRHRCGRSIGRLGASPRCAPGSGLVATPLHVIRVFAGDRDRGVAGVVRDARAALDEGKRARADRARPGSGPTHSRCIPSGRPGGSPYGCEGWHRVSPTATKRSWGHHGARRSRQTARPRRRRQGSPRSTASPSKI